MKIEDPSEFSIRGLTGQVRDVEIAAPASEEVGLLSQGRVPEDVDIQRMAQWALNYLIRTPRKELDYQPVFRCQPLRCPPVPAGNDVVVNCDTDARMDWEWYYMREISGSEAGRDVEAAVRSAKPAIPGENPPYGLVYGVKAMRHGRRAFTLIELLVVVAIISVLVALLLPALTAAREQGRSVVCRSQLRQIHIGVGFYAEDDAFGRLPNCYGGSQIGHNEGPRSHWFDEIYRFVGGPGPLKAGNVIGRRYRLYVCPSGVYGDAWWGTAPDSYRGSGNYAYCSPLGPGHWDWNYQYIIHGRVFLRQLQAPDRTMMFVDSGSIGLDNPGRFLTNTSWRHRDEANIIYCDGHATSIDPGNPVIVENVMFMRPYFPYFDGDQ